MRNALPNLSVAEPVFLLGYVTSKEVDLLGPPGLEFIVTGDSDGGF